MNCLRAAFHYKTLKLLKNILKRPNLKEAVPRFLAHFWRVFGEELGVRPRLKPDKKLKHNYPKGKIKEKKLRIDHELDEGLD